MNTYILLMVSLAASPAFCMPDLQTVEIGDDKDDITDVNMDLIPDDIMEAKDRQRSSINDDSGLWISPVSYVLENDLDMNAKGVILRALDQFRLKSCIDFKPRDSEEFYISVQKLGGCFSYIGRAQRDGQVLSIGQFCDKIHIVEHEFLHALGFYHEQSRYDRDDYVTIVSENIIEGKENNFRKVSEEDSSTQGVPYDYNSVMHYSQYAFSNGNGSTIITKDPKFQDVIGQNLEVSPSDMLELSRLYKCNSTIAFKMFCGFSNGTMCGMSRCSKRTSGDWEAVTHVVGGPSSDHTSLPSTRPESDNNATAAPGTDAGYFMHASTASGQEGDSAWLETKRMRPSRECHVQCLSFYYYHSGNQSDQLNVWIREFQDEWDSMGTLRLMAQITGQPTSHWQLRHVPLNATKHFQVEFEVHKGAGSSSGGFSIDDINLSETECPHLTWQINDFEDLLTTSDYGTYLYSPRQYSSEGYAYQVSIQLNKYYFGLYVRLVSGEYDDQLQWPCVWKQITFVMLDQNPKIQLQMSKQRSFTSQPNATGSDGAYLWENPRNSGSNYTENGQTYFFGPLVGRNLFASLDDMKTRDFLKGRSAIFLISFQDISPLLSSSALPCPKLQPVMITHPAEENDKGPCASRIMTTIPPPPPPLTTEDGNSIFCSASGMMSFPLLILLPAVMLLTP